jgi:poly(beta-D-mannuronate) lyase
MLGVRRRSLLLLALAAPFQRTFAQGALQAPFDSLRIRERHGGTVAGACVAELQARDTIAGQRFFTDSSGSQLDPVLAAADADAARPLAQWLAAIQQPTAAWLRGGPTETALCAVRHLESWARSDALLGSFNSQGAFHRLTTLGGAGLAYLALRQGMLLSSERDLVVSAWLRRVALAVMPPFDRAPPRGVMPHGTLNNHAYYAGIAVCAAGIAAGDRPLFDWGIERLRIGLRQVTEHGVLPHELARGRLALHYHLYALAPLAVLLRMATSNGVALSESELSAYQRLSRFTWASLENPSRIAAMAGTAQETVRPGTAPTRRDAIGFEIALGLYADPSIDAALAGYRPFHHRWFGGDVSLLWR